MKRILTAFVAAAMLLALIAVPAGAVGNARFTLTGPSSARPGDTITVTLNISGNYSAHALDMLIYFDNTSFRFKNAENGSALNGLTGAWPLSGLHKDGNAVSFGVLMMTDPMKVQGELLKMNFEVLSTASPRPTFTIGVNKFSNLPVGGSETPIPYTTSDLTVSISGGSGSGTTPAPAVTAAPILTPKPKTPAPTSAPRTAAPVGTPKPNFTPGPGTGRETEKPGGSDIGTPGSATAAPGEKTPQPGETVSTPLPTKSPANVTEGPVIGTNNPASTDLATVDPLVPSSESPLQPINMSELPEVKPTAEPGSAEANDPSDPGKSGENTDGALKTVLIIAACALAVGLAAVCVILGVRSKKKGKTE